VTFGVVSGRPASICEAHAKCQNFFDPLTMRAPNVKNRVRITSDSQSGMKMMGCNEALGASAPTHFSRPTSAVLESQPIRGYATSRLLCLLPLLLALAACGTTSNLQPSNPVATPASPHALAKTAALDLSGYDKVVVLDFTDATDKTKLKPEDARSYSDSMSTAVRTFADLIAQKIRSTGAFADVIRGGNADGKALVVSGRITRLVEGNGTLRFFIGFGAGSSYFEATTDVGDVESGQNLGHVVTDKIVGHWVADWRRLKLYKASWKVLPPRSQHN
jgi:hypothetical protein